MPKKQSLYLITLTLLLLLLLGACRRDQETSTPLPEVTAEATAVPDKTPVVTESTAEPEAVIEYDWPPQLVYSSPVAGEEAMLDGAITLRFDQPMDQASVEEALQVAPAEGAGTVSGSLQWPRPDTVIFTPQGQFDRQKVYSVSVADTARGRNGKYLRQPVDLQLQTVGYLAVSQTIPDDGAEEIQTDAAITVAFNRPVVPIVTTGQQAGLPQPLRFEPAVSGQGQWVSSSIYRFVPDEPLAGASEYRVTVSAGLEDVTGGLLAEDMSWTFTTLRPSIVSTFPEPQATRVTPTGPFTVTFNMPMNQAAAERAITLSPGVAVAYAWEEDGRAVTLTPRDQLDRDADYTLDISQSATSANGQATLDRDYTVRFTTVPLPAVVGTDPADGAQAHQYQGGFAVDFASPMDPETLEDQIRIEPQPDNVDLYIDNDNFRLMASFELERNTEYVITIPGTAADPWGNTLGEDYTFSFRTPPLEPMVSFNLPNQPPVSQLSTGYPSDVEVIYRNVSAIEAELYDAGLPVRSLNQFYISEDHQPSGDPIKTWSIPSELARDEVGVATLQLADGGVLPTGVYYLRGDAPEIGQEQRWWQNYHNFIVVAGTNLVVKQTLEAVYVWATDLAGGQPVSGLTLTFYDINGKQLGTATTGADGLASLDYQPVNSYLEGILVVSNAPGDSGFGVASSNWGQGIGPWQFGLSATSEKEMARFAYLYTDRPIYRPGDTVHFKGIVRDNNYGRYPLPTNESVTLTLTFLNDYSQIEDFVFTADVDGNGEFTGDYEIPEDAALGNYQFYFSVNDAYAERIFAVAEYRKPEFQVTLTPAVDQALRGQPLEVVLQAEYFFGGSASDLNVNWTIFEDDFRLPWDGPYYSFGDDGGFYYKSGYPFRFGGGGVHGNYLSGAGGTGTTDADGRLVIQLPADLLDDVDPGSRVVTIQADVMDITNFPITSFGKVIYHAADKYVGLRATDYFGSAGTETSVDLITVDWDGEPAPNSQVEVVFYRREWQPFRDRQYGMPYTRWEAEDTEVDRQVVTTDGQGEAQVSFVPQDGGQYLVVATVTGAAGREQTSSTSLWVMDANYFGWRSDPKEKRMDLTADRDEYKPGDVARILVQSPFAGPVKAWLTIERGDIIEQRVITLETGSDTLEIPVTPFYAPNVFVSLAVVKGVDESNPYADMRLGAVELIVSPEQLALTLNMVPQQDRYQPGDTAVYDILVSDYQGNPVQSSLSLALVDLAVLTLKEDNAPPIGDAFYARQPMRSQTGSGLIQSGEGLEVEVPEMVPGMGGGGDGGATLSSAKLPGEEEDIRRDFPDTAYWEATLVTGSDGRATVEIPLPDSLTTWRLSSKAVSIHDVTGETLVGQAAVDVTASLPLFVRPVTPRFFVVGDTLRLSAAVHNNSGQSQDIAVSLEAAGLTLDDPAEQTVTVADGERALVSWNVTVDDVPFADLTFRAEAGEYRDATKPTFGIAPDQLVPVVRYAGEDIVGSSGVLDEAGRLVEAILLPASVDERQGQVKVELSPSLAAALTQALDSVDLLLRDDIPCAHPYADELLPNVATAVALETLDLDQPGLQASLDGLVARDLNRLAALQLRGGGWGFCFSKEVDSFLTAYILFALTKAEQAGYEVPGDMVDRAGQAVDRFLDDPADLNERSDVNAQAFYHYVLAERGQVDETGLDALFDEHRSLLDPYAKAFLILAYELDGGGQANQVSLLADLNDSAVLSATGAHWEDAEPDWNNLSSDIRGTAIILDALARVEPDSVLAPNTVRWLMSSRTAGHWTTSHETAWTVLGLADWMAASGELEADYTYTFLVNGDEQLDGGFNATNLTESATAAVPVGDLFLDDVNFLDFQRGEGPGRLYYTAHLDSFIRAEGVRAVDRGVIVSRTYYDAACDPKEETCEPISQIQVGQQIRVELTIIAPNDLVYAVVEDPIPSGAEAIDPNLETTAADRGPEFMPVDGDDGFDLYDYWGWWYFDRTEFRDDKVVFYSQFLPAGTYRYSYQLQPVIPGQFQVIPATARQAFFPEVFGRSDGSLFTITP